MKEFLDFEKSKKAQANIDPKVMVKNDYRNGKLSSFASQDLIRLYEVMEEQESLSKLKIFNRRRLTDIIETLDMSKKDKKLKKIDFESYERKKIIDMYPWMKQQGKPMGADEIKALLAKNNISDS